MLCEYEKRLIKEQNTFIHILREFLYGESTTFNQSTEWALIKQYGTLHQLSAVVYHQTKQLVFQASFASQLYRSINFNKTIDEFKRALVDQQFLIVKGAVVSQLYPVPELRTMGDVDILIQLKDREKIHNALIDAGFVFLNDDDLGEWKYSKNNYLFEVHDTLVHRYEGKESLIEYFSHVWDYVHDGELDWSFHLLYLIEHLHQHFVGSGVGFRQFMDIVVVCMNVEIDYTWLAENLKEIGLYDFAKTVFAFIREWFDVSTPLSDLQLDDDFFIESTNRIFENGVFGFNNDENVSSDLSFMMHYEKMDYKSAKRKYFIQRLFPAYNEMRDLPYCQYLRNSKMLLPIAWLHRIIYRAFNKKSRDYIKKQLSSDQVYARMEMLHKWGL